MDERTSFRNGIRDTLAPASLDHAAAMDRKYGLSRHAYDATRAFFLFGRDGVLADLAASRPASVLEIGCGTGRNLARLAGMLPDATLHGVDVSGEMLRTASASLAPGIARGRVALARADAETLDPEAAFGRQAYDAVLMSYSLSMMRDWTRGLESAVRTVAPGGGLWIVEFGLFGPLPPPLRRLASGCLRRFQAPPCGTLAEEAKGIALREGWHPVVVRHGPLGFNQFATMRRPA